MPEGGWVNNHSIHSLIHSFNRSSSQAQFSSVPGMGKRGPGGGRPRPCPPELRVVLYTSELLPTLVPPPRHPQILCTEHFTCRILLFIQGLDVFPLNR